LELGDVAGHYHTTTKQLAKLANEVKPGLLVLYHEQNWSKPYNPDALAEEVSRYGYRGKVRSARDGDIF
jgi:ribonuclease BN (tRNA processing enzyme)